MVEYLAIHQSNAEGSIPSIPINHTAPNIWMIHPGTTLQCRMSPYHTFRIQIVGKANYVLISPEEAITSLYLYPHTHLSHDQSQVNLKKKK